MTETRTDALNELLHRELAALHACQEVLAELGEGPEMATVAHIKADHQEAVRFLRQHVLLMGGKPGSGASSGFLPLEDYFGSTGLEALQDKEVSCARAYEDALASPELSAYSKAIVRITRLPRVREHVASLTALGAVSHSFPRPMAALAS